MGAVSGYRGLLAVMALVLAGAAALGGILAGLANRLGVMHYRTGFVVLRYCAYAGLAALILALAGLWLWRPWKGLQAPLFGLLALVLGVLVVAFPLNQLRIAKSVPPINDITTDTEDPPPYAVILPLRADSPVPTGYGGPEIAAQQKKAYPDIVPLVLPEPPGEVFGRVERTARAMRWEIVGSDAAAGRLEAVDTTFFFGFKDDIVVRLRPDGSGTRVDVRSHSRVGRSDIGKNARRIRAFLQRLRAQA